jgi:hypothetical protein
LQYKRCERKAKSGKGRFIFNIPSLLLDIFGGYGTRPYRILFAVVVTIFLFSLLYFILPDNAISNDDLLFKTIRVDSPFIDNIKNVMTSIIPSPTLKHYASCLYHSIATFLTIGYGDVSPQSIEAVILSGFEGFLGLFIMAYFTGAFIRKVMMD